MRRAETTMPRPRSLAARPLLRLGLLLLVALVPVAVYAGQVTGLTTFVLGQVADADEVNANFDAVGTALLDFVDEVNLQANVLVNLFSLPGATCPPFRFVQGITAEGTLVCSP